MQEDAWLPLSWTELLAQASFIPVLTVHPVAQKQSTHLSPTCDSFIYFEEA